MKNLILTISALLIINFTFAQEKYMVRISNPDKEDYSNFYKKGYDIAAFQPGKFIDLVVNDEEFSSLELEGFSPVITLTEDQLKENLVVGKALDGYRTYEDLLLELQQIETNYPGICKLYDIGDTRGKEYANGGNSNYDNYNHESWALKVSDNVATEEDEPCIYYFGVHHAREPISLEVAMYILNHILSNYGTDPDITYDVNNKQIWFVPLVNPNGHKIVLDELDVWQRKNIADNDGDGQIDVYHADGVDPNRNYAWEWGGGGSSGDPGNEVYRGPSPFSEPETQAIRDLMMNHHFIAGITYHSHGELVLYPNGYSSGATARDHDALEDLAVNLATNIPGLYGGNYTPEEGWQLYPADGVTDDYAYGQHGIFSFTIELGEVFIPPAGDIPTICQDNLQAAMILLDRVDQNTLTGLVKDANTLLPVQAEIFIDGIDNTGVFKEPYLSDADFGRYYRFLLDGDYDVTFSAYGYIPQTFNGVNINSSNQTILDVFLNPAQSVTVTGTVTDFDTGLPIENATIEILNTPLSPVTTNINGEYTLNNVMEGNYDFMVNAGGYITTIEEVVVQNNSVLDFTLEEITNWCFESGSFEQYWTFGGNLPWTITGTGAYEGTYCSKSGIITHNQRSEMEISFSLSEEGFISFYRKVSSEANWDFLKFYIDGILLDEWSGEQSWAEVTFPVSQGNHTFKWVYTKDANTSDGSDCAWVDCVVFPTPLPPITPPYQTEFEEMGSIPDGWYNDTGDDFNWLINSGGTPSNNTGPSGDHTTGSGYYIYTEATDPNNPYKHADLITPGFNLTSLTDVEVRFWYHMYDNTGSNYMGSLHLDVFLNDVWIDDVMTPISGNQGDQWYEQVVDLTAYAGEIIELRFRGITGLGYASDICIDDFSIDGIVVAPNFSVDLTIFLEGPFNGGVMNTDLITLDDFPLSQPFYDLYGYNGGESLGSVPNPDIVDWVLVELRDANSAEDATPGTWIASQAGFVLSDGSVVGIDGNSNMFFEEAFSHELYAVIYTRNHLAVLSASELTGGAGNYTYDFSTSIVQAYGGGAGYKYLGSSIWGMVSGDGNCDGEVSILDKAPWELSAGEAGYNLNDHNMDGQVDNKDKDEYLIPAIGKVSQVPE